MFTREHVLLDRVGIVLVELAEPELEKNRGIDVLLHGPSFSVRLETFEDSQPRASSSFRLETFEDSQPGGAARRCSTHRRSASSARCLRTRTLPRDVPSDAAIR